MTYDWSNYRYERLVRQDLASFRSLMEVFAEAFEDRPAYLGATASDRYVTELLDGEHLIVLVATRDGAVVGGLAAYELLKFEQERKEIYIYDLAVSAHHRRRGVATNLIKALQSIASQRGAYVVFVQADPPDEAAVSLYDKIAVRTKAYHYDIPVPSSAG